MQNLLDGMAGAISEFGMICCQGKPLPLDMYRALCPYRYMPEIPPLPTEGGIL